MNYLRTIQCVTHTKRAKGNPQYSVIQERMIAKTSNTTRLVDKLLLKELVTRKVRKTEEK
jgi:DNA-binding MarR family transcriptional regulator